MFLIYPQIWTTQNISNNKNQKKIKFKFGTIPALQDFLQDDKQHCVKDVFYPHS